MAASQILTVPTFEALVSARFDRSVNAICWQRQSAGDFTEIVRQMESEENVLVIEEQRLNSLHLSRNGEIARALILSDLQRLSELGFEPVLNLIRCYERDDTNPFFPTDVYSFHVDRSPIPTDTFLCTYAGSPSEILPYSQAEKKVLVPELRQKIREQYTGSEDGFESFLAENCLDLHYQPRAFSQPVSMGNINLWRLAVDYPGSPAQACIHRAPDEGGTSRLLLIC